MISQQRRDEIVDALRRGTVPERGLADLAVGLGRFLAATESELQSVASARSHFKAVRGEYGAGKTFFSRWLQEKARQIGFATAEVQISETETPLHRLETVYRRLMENLCTVDANRAAFRSVIDGWFFTLEEDVLSDGGADEDDDELLARTDELMEQRLAPITRSTPAFAAGLRGYRRALVAGDNAIAEGLLAWLCGQPNVAAATKRYAGIKGEVDHFGALSFLQALLLILRDSGHPGMMVVLDEVETLQRVRSDVRERGLNALRQLMDEVDGGRFPGLYLVITGTPAFFDGTQGVQRLPPLAQRLHVDFETDSSFDNPRAVQIRLKGFDLDSLVELGVKVRDIYLQGAERAESIQTMVDDTYVRELAVAVTGRLGGKVGIAPRVFLKKLVGDVLDRVDQFPDFAPREHYSLTVSDRELTEVERNVGPTDGVDEIQLEL
jgi:hypothetical protein